LKELNRLLEIIANISAGRYSNDIMELTGPATAEPVRTIAEAMGLMMVKVEARRTFVVRVRSNGRRIGGI
jgi:hypothetical protein